MDHEFTILNNILDQSGCDKKQVAAGCYIQANGIIFDEPFVYATNSCKHEGVSCPRINLPSGEGYDLCRAKHAEIALIDKVNNMTKGLDVWYVPVVWVYGHYYACEQCASALKSMGVEEVRIRERF